MIISREDIMNSSSLSEYKETARRICKLYYPRLQDFDINRALDYSIQKRFQNHEVFISNTYTGKRQKKYLLELADYIKDRQPIVTAHGTMFRRHTDKQNPILKVIESFMAERGIHKKQMFQYPKGSEQYEHYNLLQQLDKINCNS